MSSGDGSRKRKRSWFEKWGLLEKHSRRPYKLSVHCFFNVTYSLLKKGERRNILLTNFLIVVAVTVKHFAFCLRLPENNFYLKRFTFKFDIPETGI